MESARYSQDNTNHAHKNLSKAKIRRMIMENPLWHDLKDVDCFRCWGKG